MNNKGFTLIELLAVFVLLSIIIGITGHIFGFNFDETKKKTEEAFVATIKDSLEVYLTSSNAKGLNFQVLTDESGRECYLNKTHGNVKIYEGIYKDKNTGDTRDTNFLDVINSEYHPITQKDLVNPADKDLKCKDADEIEITIYRDSDYVYYYSVNKSEFGCLKNNGEIELKDGSKVKYPTVITNLPEGIVCE